MNNKKPIKVDIDLQKDLFRWGPAPLHYFYQSDFNITIGDGLYEKEYPKYVWPPSIALYMDHKILWMNEFDTLHSKGAEVFEDVFSTGKIKSIRDEYNRRQQVLFNILELVETTALPELSDGHLLSLWRKLHESISSFISPSLVPELCNYGSDSFLEKKLKKLLGETSSSVANLMEILTAPEEISFYQKEEIDLSESVDIKMHQKNYYWIGNSYFKVEILPISFFEDRKREVKSDLQNIAKKRIQKTIDTKKEARDKYGLPDYIIQTGKNIAYDIVWQDDRKRTVLQYLHYKELLLNEIVKRKKLTKDDMLNFSYMEIAEIFSGKECKVLIEDRRKGFSEYITNKRTIFDSFDTKKYFELVQGKKIDDTVDEFKGIVASTGNAIGKVRILSDPEHVDCIKCGEVLVSPMTTPEYIFAMRKSSAIVTDTGGLTSHAAIVSRELQIPCIVGTKIATQVLKDGDMVEVDADKGVVKILKRK